MKKLKKNYEFRNNYFFKKTLPFFTSNLNLINNNEEDPIIKIVYNFEDFKKIEINNIKILDFLYFNIEKVNKMLYDSDKVINVISTNDCEIKLSYYFYLSLLICYNKNIINFEYNINIINKIFNQKFDDSKQLKKIIKSKIISDLIHNYKGFDNYKEDENSEQFGNIINDSVKIIINNINIFKELNLEIKNFKGLKIDEIYIKIINELIIKKKLEEYEYSYNIIEQLDLESINLTKSMINELSKILDDNNNYIKDYIISKYNDLLDIKKINFFFILLKYILKNSIYIYQIPFLFKTKKAIILIIKSDLNKLLSFDIEDNIKKRMEYIIEIITDSKYYFLKYIKYKLNEVLKYYKDFLFESKKEDINLIENLLKNYKIDNYEKYLKDFNKAQKINKRSPIIKYIYNIKKQNNNIQREILLTNCIEFLESLEDKINNKSLNKMEKNDIKIIYNFFKDEKNKKLLLQIFKEDKYDFFIKENISFNVEKYDNNNQKDKEVKKNEKLNQTNNTKQNNSYSQITDSKESNQIKSINYGDNSNYTINKEDNNSLNNNIQINSSIFKELSEDKKENNINIIDKNKQSNNEKNFINLNNNNDLNLKIMFLEFIQKIEKKSSLKTVKENKESSLRTLEFIKELKNDYLITSGLNNYLYIYDCKEGYNTLEIFNPRESKEWIYSICEINTNTDNFIFEIVIFFTDKYYTYQFRSLDNYEIKLEKKKKGFSYFCLTNLDKGNIYVLCGYKGAKISKDLHNKIEEDYRIEEIYENSICGGMLIDNLLILMTNNMISNINQLYFFNIETEEKHYISIRDEFTFNLSQNNLAYTKLEDCKEKGILLCACKKYIKNQKNGILLIYFNSGNNFDKISEIEKKFYRTGSFEVYCFCFISIYEQEVKDEILNKNFIKKESNYFFVGGFEVGKSKGVIKLYKLIYNNTKKQIEIECIDNDIFYKNLIKKPISCIIQRKNSLDILATSWDGEIYLFKLNEK